jgi:hypothetical protein
MLFSILGLQIRTMHRFHELHVVTLYLLQGNTNLFQACQDSSRPFVIFLVQVQGDEC